MQLSYWCVLIAIFMPYFCFGIARNRARSLRDNANPRDFPNRIEGLPKRAWDAQLNSFEALPGFLAAVLIAQIANVPQAKTNALAMAWVAARIVYIGCYLGNRPRFRTIAQLASLLCVIGLFAAAALNGQ